MYKNRKVADDIMFKKIRKRDGREVPFDREKIASAIEKAVASTAINTNYQRMANNATTKVVDYLEKNYGAEEITVETVQDAVETVLMQEVDPRVAKTYILYRAERARAREMNSKLMKTYESLTFSQSKESDIKRENANIDGDTSMGTMLRYGSEGAKQFNHLYLLDREASEAHKSGDIHIHDLDFYALTTTCTQLDLSRLFKGGFSTGHGFLREPNDIRSYSALACIAIQANQNDQHKHIA